MPNKADFLLDDISPPTPSGNIRPLIGRSIVTWSPLPPAQTQPEESGSDRLDLGDVARRPTSGITSRVAGGGMRTGERRAQGGDSTPYYPRCVGSNWREMGPFWTYGDGNGVSQRGCFLRGLTHVWVCF